MKETQGLLTLADAKKMSDDELHETWASLVADKRATEVQMAERKSRIDDLKARYDGFAPDDDWADYTRWKASALNDMRAVEAQMVSIKPEVNARKAVLHRPTSSKNERHHWVLFACAFIGAGEEPGDACDLADGLLKQAQERFPDE